MLFLHLRKAADKLLVISSVSIKWGQGIGFFDVVLCASPRPLDWAGTCVMLLCSLWKVMSAMRQRRWCYWMPFALLVPFLVAFRLHQWAEPLPRALGHQGWLHHLQLPGIPGGPAAAAQDPPAPEEAGVPTAGAGAGREPGQGLSPHPEHCALLRVRWQRGPNRPGLPLPPVQDFRLTDEFSFQKLEWKDTVPAFSARKYIPHPPQPGLFYIRRKSISHQGRSCVPYSAGFQQPVGQPQLC